MTDLETRLEQSRRLSRMLVLASERAKADFAASVAHHDLPVALSRALLVLVEPTSMRDLATQIGVDPSYVTGLADQLEERGLIARVPGRDRRVTMLAATEAGSSVRAALLAAVTTRPLFVERLDAAESEALAVLLGKLLAE